LSIFSLYYSYNIDMSPVTVGLTLSCNNQACSGISDVQNQNWQNMHLLPVSLIVSASASVLRNSLHWLPVRQRFIYKTALVTYKTLKTGQSV